MECKICGSAMQLWNNEKWICTNPACTNVILKNARAWYIELGEDNNFWNEKIIKAAPSVLACEYKSLRDMLLQGEVSGLPIKIKDIFEVALKFPVLIILSDAFAQNTKKNFFNGVLYGLICKLPSLGDWYNAAHELIKTSKIENPVLAKILKDIDEIYQKNQIVNWRNNVIGHGAFNSTENENFRADLIDKIKIIVEHFNRFADDYSKIRLLCKHKKLFIPLAGSEKATNLKYSNDDLYFEMDGSKRPVIPLIRNLEGGVFFFDSYIVKKNKTSYLNYIGGNKIKNVDEQISRLYKNLFTANKILLTETSAEAEIRGKRSESSVEEILKPSQLIPFDFLQEKFSEIISDNERGIYLLQMKNGMGKTTFIKMLDGAAYHKIKIQGVMCRAFYINGVYSHSKLTFLQGLTDSMRRAENGDNLVGDIPTVDVNSADGKNQVAELINKLFDANKKISGFENLLFVIDGVDELPNVAGTTIADLIPEKQQLASGVHLLITCRTPDQTSVYTKNILEKFSFDEIISVDENNSDYRAVLKKFVAQRTAAPPVIVEKIVSAAENRMLNIENLIRAYLQIGEKFFEGAPRNLFEILRELYGERYYNEIFKFAARLAAMPVPITIYDLAHLADEETVSFKLIAYIGELKPILNISHEVKGSFITITRPEVREMLKASENIFSGIYAEWLNDLQESPKLKNIDEKLFLLEYLALCAAPAKYRSKFIQGKIFIDCSKILAPLIKTKDGWNYETLNELLKILCYEIAPLFSENRYDKNIEALVFVAQQLAEEIQNHSGNLAEIVENLKKLFEIIQAKEFDAPTQYDFCTIIATMLAKIQRESESEKYFAIADKILHATNITTVADKNNSDSILNTLSLIKNDIQQAVFDKNAQNFNRAIKNLTHAENLIVKLEKAGYAEYGEVVSVKISALQTFGNIYKRTFPEKALKYFLEAISIHNSVKNKTVGSEAENSYCQLLLNTGQTYRVLQEYDKAAKTYDEAISLAKSLQIRGELIENEMLASLYLSRGNIERDLNHPRESITFYNEAMKIADAEEKAGHFINPNLVESVRLSLAAAHKKLENFSETNTSSENEQVKNEENWRRGSQITDYQSDAEKIVEKGRAFSVKGDYENALKYFTIAAEAGHTTAMELIAFMYMQGLGNVTTDTALKWLKKSAELGNPDSMLTLAQMYLTGKGVKQDFKEARKYCKAAAKINHPFAADVLEMVEIAEKLSRLSSR